jgi:GNAT superfamily N-acetyltransferase
MDKVQVNLLTEPSSARLTELAAVFDQYRQHYGEPAAPEDSRKWLAEQLARERLFIFAAQIGDDVVGLAAVADLPASLSLRSFWQIRDLFVVPFVRRKGVGRALLSAVQEAATEAHAMRLSVQTESDNNQAISLYLKSGFHPLEGFDTLIMPLRAESENPS